MNATKKLLIVDSVYCVAKSLSVMFIVFAPRDVSMPLFAAPLRKLDMLLDSGVVPYFTCLWGVPLVLVIVTATFVRKASGFRWKGFVAAVIAWIAFVTVLETIYLGDLLFGWVAHVPT